MGEGRITCVVCLIATLIMSMGDSNRIRERLRLLSSAEGDVIHYGGMHR